MAPVYGANRDRAARLVVGRTLRALARALGLAIGALSLHDTAARVVLRLVDAEGNWLLRIVLRRIILVAVIAAVIGLVAAVA